MLLRPLLAGLAVALMLSACTQSTPQSIESPASVEPLGSVVPLGQVQFMLDYEGHAKVIGRDSVGQAAELPNSSITFKTRYAGAFDDVVTNRRYIWATFELTNTTTSTLKNLTMYAYSKAGTSALGNPYSVAGTALYGIRNFGGDLITSDQVARSIRPIHSMKRTSLSPKVNPEEADFQAFSAAEAQAFETAAKNKGYLGVDDKVLEYGFVARNLTGGRSIAPGGTGVVTLNFKMPRPAAVDTPYQFNISLALADQPTIRVTRGLDDTTAEAKARAAAITDTGTKEVVLIGTDTDTAGTGYTTKRLANVLLTRNTDPSTPATYLLDP